MVLGRCFSGEGAGVSTILRVGMSLSVLFCVIASASLQAASLPDPSAQGVLQQETRQAQAAQMLPEQGNQLRAAAQSSLGLARLPVESPCFVIHKIDFSGAHVRHFYWLDAFVRPVIGQCVGIRGLDLIAHALNDELLDRGYATSRAGFPPQKLSTGVLNIHLNVGTVAGVRMVREGDGKPDTGWGTWRNAFPVTVGDVLDIRDLEQGVESMDTLSSQSVHTLLEPGPEPDTSVVVIQRKHEGSRLHGGITLDNSGSEYVGRPMASTLAVLDNAAGLNDILSLNASSNIERVSGSRRSQSLGASYSIPWNYSLFTLSENYVRYAQIVQGTTAQFLSSGTTRITRGQWDWTLWRSASTKFGVFAALFTEQASNYLNNVEVVVQQLNTVNFDRGISTTIKLPSNGEIDARLDYRTGLASDGAQNDLPTATQGGLTVRPDIWGLTASWNQPFTLAGSPLQFSSTLHGQATRDTLISEDQIYIGDRYSVRGFDGNTILMADSGYAWRNELSRSIAGFAGWQQSVYAAVDAGRVWGPSAANLVGTELAGAAIGLRGQQKFIRYDLALATPLYHPAGFDSGRLNAYLSITTLF